jgi:choice-of-anchor A domain-containing protein/uncharacterized repeat protein (TIGR01451 family)
MERLENRELLSLVNDNFIQGTVFVDNQHTGTPMVGDIFQSATLTLTGSDGSMRTAVSDPVTGQYLFDNLPAVDNSNNEITYTLTESTLPAGYTFNKAYAFAQIDSTNVSGNSITIRFPPTTTLTTQYTGVVAGGDVFLSFQNGGLTPNLVGQLGMKVSPVPTPSGSPTTASINTYCVGLFAGLDTPPYASYTEQASTYFASVKAAKGLPVYSGQIAYLFNNFGTAPPTTHTTVSTPSGPVSVTPAEFTEGLQYAIWKLEYDRVNFTDPSSSFNDPNSHLYIPTPPNAQSFSSNVYWTAVQLIKQSAGQNDLAMVLNFDNSNPAVLGQQVLATRTFNLTNVQTPTPPVGLTITKTPDQATVNAGSQIGYTVTIVDTGGTAANVVLNDPLPAGAGGDIFWTISPSGTTTNWSPAISGAQGSQVLSATMASMAPGTYSVHIVSPTNNGDATGGMPAPGFGGTGTLPLGDAGNYAVLYQGTGGHNLQITDVTINGSIGVGGTGHVQFNSMGTIGGRLDFLAANTGQYSNGNSSNVGPTSVNYNVAAVATALSTVNSLNSSLAGLGSNLVINGTQTINESAGQLATVNGVTYRVFNVISYSEGNGNLLTINGDGSGDPVIFNVGFNSNVNLGGDVSLTGGLTDDDVLWNFTSSGKSISLNNNASSFPLPLAFHGVILAPSDTISIDNANLNGRVFGGGSGDMQIFSCDTINAPAGAQVVNTATVSATGLGPQTATGTITILTVPENQHPHLDGPQVVSLLHYGFHMRPRTIVLQFNEPLAPTPATDLRNYSLRTLGGVPIPIASATYNAGTDTVTLLLATRPNMHHVYVLTVNGSTPTGLTDLCGYLLDGKRDGKPGSDFVGLLSRANWVGIKLHPWASRA